MANSPLSVEAVSQGSNLAIHWDNDLQSNALGSYGPFDSPAVGTGTLALKFDDPICYFGFKVALDGLYSSQRSTDQRHFPEGTLNIRFYDEHGTMLGQFRRYYPEGPVDLGYMQAGSAIAQVSGILIQNLDMRGIMIDELIFEPGCPLKLF